MFFEVGLPAIWDTADWELQTGINPKLFAPKTAALAKK
jgi:hypothetical protein